MPKKYSKEHKAMAKSMKQIRRKNELTQDEFAKTINVSIAGYGKYEREERDIPVSVHLVINERFNECPLQVLPINFDEKPEEINTLVSVPENTSNYKTKRPQSFRQQFRGSYETFLNETYSTSRRKWIMFQARTFATATICFVWKVLIPNTQLSNEIDWTFLLSFILVLIFLPLQFGTIFRFFHWRKQAV